MSLHISVWSSAPPTRQICVEIDSAFLFLELLNTFKFLLKLDKMRYFTWGPSYIYEFMTIYCKVVRSWNSLYQHAPCIVPTKYTVLTDTDIKWVCPACLGTSILFSGRTQCQFLKTSCHCRVVMTCVLEDSSTNTPHTDVYCCYSWEMAIGFFKTWPYVLPEDGTLVPKHDGDAHLMFVWIKTVQLVCIVIGVHWLLWPLWLLLLPCSPQLRRLPLLFRLLHLPQLQAAIACCGYTYVSEVFHFTPI